MKLTKGESAGIVSSRVIEGFSVSALRCMAIWCWQDGDLLLDNATGSYQMSKTCGGIGNHLSLHSEATERSGFAVAEGTEQSLRKNARKVKICTESPRAFLLSLLISDVHFCQQLS
jgi:hypothetical protein